MKKTTTLVIVLVVLVVLIVGGVLVYERFGKYREETKIEEGIKTCSIKLNSGQSYNVKIGRFESPYTPKYIEDVSKINYGDIKGFLDGQISVSGHGWQNFLSTLDEGMREEAIKIDTEGGNVEGVYTSGDYSKSFEEKYEESEYPEVFTHWVELNKNGKTYLIIIGKFEKEEQQQQFEGVIPVKTAVKKDGKWLYTKDLDSEGIVGGIAHKNYDELVRDCK